MANFEALPTELQAMVMMRVPDFRTLHTLAIASKSARALYRRRPSELLLAVIANTPPNIADTMLQTLYAELHIEDFSPYVKESAAMKRVLISLKLAHDEMPLPWQNTQLLQQRPFALLKHFADIVGEVEDLSTSCEQIQQKAYHAAAVRSRNTTTLERFSWYRRSTSTLHSIWRLRLYACHMRYLRTLDFWYERRDISHAYRNLDYPLEVHFSSYGGLRDAQFYFFRLRDDELYILDDTIAILDEHQYSGKLTISQDLAQALRPPANVDDELATRSPDLARDIEAVAIQHILSQYGDYLASGRRGRRSKAMRWLRAVVKS